MEWLFLTDENVVAALRQRCRQERLAQNMTQQDLAERAGLGITTVRRFERDDDSSPTLATFIGIVRVLGALEVLEQLLPDRPVDPLAPNASTRQRARPSPAKSADGAWTWGEQS